MRLSLGLKVPKLEFDEQHFQKLTNNLLKRFPDAKLEDLNHLTIPLLQLGDMGQGSLMGIYQQLKALTADHTFFELKLLGLWAYPHQSEADLLWIGVQNSKELRSLQQTMADYLVLDESAWIRPHIPLVHLNRPADVTDLISPFKNFDFGEVQIEEVMFTEKLAGSPYHRMVGSHKLLNSSI